MEKFTVPVTTKMLTLALACLVISACAGRNPYYLMHIGPPSFDYFNEYKSRKKSFDIKGGKQTGYNEFEYHLPDSLKPYQLGMAILECVIDTNTLQLKNVNVFRLELYNAADTAPMGYEKYGPGAKQIKPPPHQFDRHVNISTA